MKHKIQRLETTTTHKFIDVTLRYDKGGFSYATYKQLPRGYYLSVLPIESRDCGNGVVMESFVGFSGVSALMEPCARYNANVFKNLAASATDTELYRSLLEQVLNQQKLLLAGVPVIAAAEYATTTGLVPA